MNRLKIFQLVVIFIFIFLTYIKLKGKASTFAASPSLIVPWNQTQEKNKIYIYMRDPLGFDLQMSYKDVIGTAKIPYNWEVRNFNKVRVRDRILIEDDARFDLVEKVDGCVSLQNMLVDDLDKILLNLNAMYGNSYYSGIKRDYTSVTKIDITQTTKYKRLFTGVAEGGNIIQCGSFYPTIANGAVFNADYFWETSQKYVGAFNNDIKGDTIFYKNWGDEYDIYDESSVTFDGRYGSLGRYSKKMNAEEKNIFKGKTNNGKLWNASYWEQIAKKPIEVDLNSYVQQGVCMVSDCLSYTTFNGYLVEPDGWKNQYLETSKAIFFQALNYFLTLAVVSLITVLVGPIGYLAYFLSTGPGTFIGMNYVRQYISIEQIQTSIFQLAGIDILAWMDTFDWIIVYREFPPAMPNGELFGQSAVLSYINLQTSIDVTKIPYMRQRVSLKKQYSYFLSFSFFGFVPLIVNFINISTGEKTELLTQNDVSYPHWIYRSTTFSVANDDDYYIEFTLNVIGDNVKYPGTDPDNNKHKWNGRSVVDNVVLEIVDEVSTFDNYSQFEFSNAVRDNEVYISMNGKIQKMSILNDLNSLDPVKTNERRTMISNFITKNYIV
jgi:hypothetical protein